MLVPKFHPQRCGVRRSGWDPGLRFLRPRRVRCDRAGIAPACPGPGVHRGPWGREGRRGAPASWAKLLTVPATSWFFSFSSLVAYISSTRKHDVKEDSEVSVRNGALLFAVSSGKFICSFLGQ